MARIGFPSFYDLVMMPADLLGLRRHRRAVVSQATGLTLEIGAGTGLNLRHHQGPESLVALDSSLEMLGILRERSGRRRANTRAVAGLGERLPFADGTFDSTVITLSLCTIADPSAALREVRRVLKPTGRLHFMEHVAHRRRAVQRLQLRLTPWWRRVAGGCHLNRKTSTAIEGADFEVISLARRGFGWLELGVAVPRGHP